MVGFSVSALAVVVLIGVLLVAHISLSSCQNLGKLRSSRENGGSGGSQGGGGGSQGLAVVAEADLIHVCFALDDPDFRPLVIAARSVIASTATPERLRLHFITSKDSVSRLRAVARLHLPGVRIQVHSNEALASQIRSFVAGTDTDAFEYVPFYLDEFLASDGVRAERIIFVGSEVVVQADVVTELAALNLGGRAVAAVRECDRELASVVDLQAAANLGYNSHFDPLSCLPRPNLLVVDREKWRQHGLTAKMEEWVLKSARPGVASPWRLQGSLGPWLLTLGAMTPAAHQLLPPAWSCAGLTRRSMSASEGRALRQQGLTDEAMKTLRVRWDEDGNGRPSISLCPSAAKALHFIGASEAWLESDETQGSSSSLCAAPPMLDSDLWSETHAVQLNGQQGLLVPCAELRSVYISDAALVDEGDTEDDEDEETQGDGVGDGTAAWKSSHQEFVDKLKKQSQASNEQSEERAAQKSRIKDKLNKKMKKKEEELNRKRVIGGFVVGQNVRSVADVSVKRQVVVAKGALGVIQGPAVKNPLTRINVFFKGRLDGKFRSVNVLPREIEGA